MSFFASTSESTQWKVEDRGKVIAGVYINKKNIQSVGTIYFSVVKVG